MSLWLLLTLAMGSVGYYAVWSRFPSKARWLALVAFLVASPVAGLSLLLSLGWAAPVLPVIASPKGDLDVLGVKLEPEVAIYLMLDLKQGPRLFRLPWDAERASKIQRMMEEGSGKIKARITQKGDQTLSGEFFEGNPETLIPTKPPEQRHTF